MLHLRLSAYQHKGLKFRLGESSVAGHDPYERDKTCLDFNLRSSDALEEARLRFEAYDSDRDLDFQIDGLRTSPTPLELVPDGFLDLDDEMRSALMF